MSIDVSSYTDHQSVILQQDNLSIQDQPPEDSRITQLFNKVDRMDQRIAEASQMMIRNNQKLDDNNQKLDDNNQKFGNLIVQAKKHKEVLYEILEKAQGVNTYQTFSNNMICGIASKILKPVTKVKQFTIGCYSGCKELGISTTRYIKDSIDHAHFFDSEESDDEKKAQEELPSFSEIF